MCHTEVAIHKFAFRKAKISQIGMEQVAIEKFTIFIIPLGQRLFGEIYMFKFLVFDNR